MSAPVYLDYQATTPLAPEARDAMLPFLTDSFGNPHSSHRMGREASAAVEVARGRVMECLGADEGQLVFTSGATEAANWAIKGALANAPEGRNRIVTLATEHACILDVAEFCAAKGYALTVLDVGADGLVDLADMRAVLGDNVALVAAMLVNNEIGVIQSVAEIGAMARKCGALMLCDAVQGLGRVDVPWEDCDMIAMSSHKIHGPKGIGALWLRDGVTPEPLLHGGGQEADLRSGTLAPALCAGFGAAAQLMTERRDEDARHVETLWSAAMEALDGGWHINGSRDRRYHGNLNIRRNGLDVARLMSDVRGVAFSVGSACASGSGRPSHVLAALGLSGNEARSSIRLGFGRYTSEEDLNAALELILKAAQQQETIPAW